MCSLDFFFKPREQQSFFGDFFELGAFKGAGCSGSTMEFQEAAMLIVIVFSAAALLALVLIYFTRKALNQGRSLAQKCDHLQRAIVEHDEFCAKRGIRGRAETFDAACVEGFFLDVGTMHAWLSVNNLESNIEVVERSDYADLLPTGEEFLEIEDMRRAFANIVATMKATKKLPADMDVLVDPEDYVEPEPTVAAVTAVSAHKLVGAGMDVTPATSRQKSIAGGVEAPTPLVATTPPPEPEPVAAAAIPAAAAEKEKLLAKKK